MELFTPFVQYDVHPKLYNENKIDILPFHFYQNPKLLNKEGKVSPDCSYIYDLLVVSSGQLNSGNFNYFTPILIDPEVKSDGVIINQ